jgi:hypothetical protein
VTGRTRAAGPDSGPLPHPISRPVSFLAPDAAATLHLVRENLRLLAALCRRHEVGRLDAPDAPQASPPHRPAPKQWVVGAPADVAAYLGPELTDLAQEQLRALLLTAKHTLLSCVLVAQGSVDGAPCRLADAFREAVRAGAAAVLFVHNHPSGDPEPSPDDVRFTADAARAGALLGIRVVDHVVIGRGPGERGDPVRYASLRERGLYAPDRDDGDDPAETEGARRRPVPATPARRVMLWRRRRRRGRGEPAGRPPEATRPH